MSHIANTTCHTHESCCTSHMNDSQYTRVGNHIRRATTSEIASFRFRLRGFVRHLVWLVRDTSKSQYTRVGTHFRRATIAETAGFRFRLQFLVGHLVWLVRDTSWSQVVSPEVVTAVAVTTHGVGGGGGGEAAAAGTGMVDVFCVSCVSVCECV